MDWLGVLLNALPGSYAASLKMLLEKIAELRDSTGGVPAERLQVLYDFIRQNAGGAITPEAIAAGVTELLAVLQGKNFGPPNPGAGAVA